MNEDYVNYDLALKLKACGFDWKTDHLYRKDADNGDQYTLIHSGFDNYNEYWNASDWCSAPTLAHAQKWLREKKKMHCQVLLNGVRSMYFWQVRERVGNGRYADSAHQYDVYEDAMSDCISAALELIKKGE